MKKVLIIEDNADEAATLARCVERYGHAHGEAFGVTVMASAMDYIAEGGAWDVVFLDIDLPGINGMEAAQLIRTYDPVTPIIFETNLAQYAVRGYEVDALGFIVKPVTYEGFRLPMDRAMRVLRHRGERTVRVSAADGIHLVAVSDVMWVEVVDHNLHWHMAGTGGASAVLVERSTLKKAIGDLADGPMVRVSNHTLANTDYVQTITRDALVMADGSCLRFSRARKKDALKALADHLGRAR